MLQDWWLERERGALATSSSNLFGNTDFSTRRSARRGQSATGPGVAPAPGGRDHIGSAVASGFCRAYTCRTRRCHHRMLRLISASFPILFYVP